MRTLVRRHPLGTFYGLAILFSWGYWVPVAILAPDTSHVPGLLGPMLAAFVVAAADGRPAVGGLLARMARWRVPVRWYVAAVAPLVVGLLGVAGLALAGRDLAGARLDVMPGVADLGWLGVVALLLVFNGFGEEVGWRGVAWPHLRHHHGLAGAAVRLAVPWAVWHLPTFWLDTGLGTFPKATIPGWLVGLAAGAVVLGWLFEHARNSLLVVALFHVCLNMASATEATEGLPAAITSAGVIVAAIAILRHEARHAAPAQRLPTAAHHGGPA